MNYLWFLAIFSLLAPPIENANILILLPLPSKSHHVMFESIIRGLAQRGHNVDFASHFPIKTPPKGYNDLSLVGSLPIFVNNLTIDAVRFNTQFETLDFMLHDCGVNVCKAVFKSETLKLLKQSKKKYDLVITEIFAADCMVGFAHIFKAPLASITSSVNLPWGSDRFGNPDNPSYIPTYLNDFTPKMTLSERLFNTLTLLNAKIKHYFSNVAIEEDYKNFFGADVPSIQKLIQKTSLFLVNSHFSTNQARPTVPGFIEIGGVHINDPKPLNEHFQKLMQTDTKGIIYLSMGSMVKTESFPKHKIQALLDAFSEIPYKVIWKANYAEFPKDLRFPPNVHFEQWMPQLDILCSGKVKLFVSHGGLMGSQEATYCGVARLGIPIFSDQDLNIRQAENMGQALRVSYDDLSKERLMTALNELLSDGKYEESARKYGNLFKDRPMTPLNTAIYWIEYVIRHKGAPHLKSAAIDLPWYQYHLIDVSFILITPLLVIGYVFCKIVKSLHKAKIPVSKLKQK